MFARYILHDLKSSVCDLQSGVGCREESHLFVISLQPTLHDAVRQFKTLRIHLVIDVDNNHN